jgi:hypothetical protein
MLNTKFILAGLFISFSLTFSACKKDNENADEDFQSTAEDIGQAENISSDVDNMTCRLASNGTFSNDNAPDPSFDQFSFHSCATVTNDSVNHILLVDFGSGCTGADGKTRAGRIIINYNGTGYFDPGSSWVMTFDSFYVNSRHVEGTRSVVNNGLNGSGNMTWSIDAQNMRITRPDGSWRAWNSQRTREIVSGFGDNTWTNDVYLINGTMSGSNSNGQTITGTITNVRRDHSCHFITAGTMTMTPSGRPARTIDFGNGTCDDLATVTRNGVTRTIHLRF